MILSNKELAQYAELNELGFRPSIAEGDCVGRGFADLGYEQFLILPGGKLLSLFTGTLSALSEIEQNRLFLVPSTDQLIEALAREGAHDLTLVQERATRWGISCVHSQQRRECHDSGIQSALCALLKILLQEKR